MNLIGADGTAQVSYDYDDFGETTVYDKNKEKPFYNEICYTAGVYDRTTGLYNLNARYYDPENGSFLTQDTYRGSRSRTETLNLYTYCAGNPISYSDPSGHWIGSVIGAAMGAYDGYKYAKKKNLKGWRKGAAILGGAALGAVNPFKLYKAGKTGYKAYKATKYGKKAASTYKKAKAGKKAKSKPKVTTVTKKSTKTKSKPKVTKSAVKTAKKETKRVKAACFTAGTKIHTKDGFKNIESIKAGDYVWSENPETHEKALKKVNKIFVREKDSIIRLSINGEIVETTDEHPFYVEGQGFTEAKNLNAGDEVRLESGKPATIDSTETIKLDEPIKVYNFEVEDFHTYYVSEQTVLVHNTCAETIKNTTKSKYWSKSTEFKGKKVYQRDDLIDINRVNEDGLTNLELMKKGKAPIGPDGKPINLHHMIQTEDSAIVEITQSMHQKYTRIIHINPNSMQSAINRAKFGRWRAKYWKNRAKDFEN